MRRPGNEARGNLASFPGLLTPAFVACCTTALALQVTNAGVRRPGNEARGHLLSLQVVEPVHYSTGTMIDKFTLDC